MTGPGDVPVALCPSVSPSTSCGRTVIVVDASVLVTALADDGEAGSRARGRLRGQELAAPELIDLEVPSVLRRLLLGGHLSPERAEHALSDLLELPLRRAPHRPLLSRCWDLRENMTIYDASYVALAEELGAALLTADARLSRAPGLACEVEVLAGSGEDSGENSKDRRASS